MHIQHSVADHTQETHCQEVASQQPDGDHLPPPQYPTSEASSSARPPPFSSLFATTEQQLENSSKLSSTLVIQAEASGSSAAAPAYSDAQGGEDSVPFDPDQGISRAFLDHVAETKRALPTDTKGESSRKDEEVEPPPAYSEGTSPLDSFVYLMASAGGAASIITQVQQGGPPINTIGGEYFSV